MIAVIKNGSIEQIVESVAGMKMAGRTVLDVPADYDPAACNYVLTNGAFVPNSASALTKIRERRDRIIAATDFVEFSRRLSVQQRTEGLAYRDALFDLPETTPDPFAPQWPTAPSWLTTPD